MEYDNISPFQRGQQDYLIYRLTGALEPIPYPPGGFQHWFYQRGWQQEASDHKIFA